MRNSAGSPNQSRFATVSGPQVPRSKFSRPFRHSTTFDEGQLIPFMVEEILPGDVMTVSGNFLLRLATPKTPYMDNVFADIHYFFCPDRILWENFEKQQGAQDDPGDSIDYLTPQLDDATHAAGFAQLSVYDYMGLPTKVPNIPQADMPISMPLRAYGTIWNEWYRDENLQDSLDIPTDDGPDVFAYAVYLRNRRKDYFTSGLPSPQKGNAVTFPLSGLLDVQLTSTLGVSPLLRWNGNHVGYASNGLGSDGSFRLQDNSSGDDLVLDPNGTLKVDLGDALQVTVNQFREAVAMQHILERDARSGTRYVEHLLGHWGVVSPDFRLQRPEFLGQGTAYINVNPIAQTSETDGSPQGNLAAFAVGRGRNGFTHSFVEHGWVIGIISVRADNTYQQGLHRKWSRLTRYDRYLPDFANLGEQAVLNKEIFMQGAAGGTDDNDPFAYQEHWSEYRYGASMVTGLFRSNATGTLDFWHLAMDFDTLPELADIVPENPPIERIIAVTSQPHFICDIFMQVEHTRPMPMYSNPGLRYL